jgi:hypothetical protein
MTLCDHIKITCTVCLAWINLIDWLVFNANFSSISAISWCEQILYYIKLDTYKIIRNKTYLSKKTIALYLQIWHVWGEEMCVETWLFVNVNII